MYFLHSLFLSSDYSSQTNISLKAIYLFNLFSVIFVCSVLKLNSRIKNPANPLGLFVFTTIIKMATAIIILFPVFNLEKENLFIDHIMDSHDFHVMDWNGHAVSVPLPVILWTNNGLVAFMSSEFHHDDSGTVVVNRKEQSFIKYHGTIYYANQNSSEKLIQFDGSNHPINQKPLDFSITKLVFSMFLSIIIIFILFRLSARSYARSNRGEPVGIAKFTEPIVLFIKEEVALPFIGEDKYEKYVPFLLTLFFFIWINNIIDMALDMHILLLFLKKSPAPGFKKNFLTWF